VDLHYGEGILSLNIPQGNIAEIIRPWQQSDAGRHNRLVEDAIGGKMGRSFAQATAGKRLCVLVGDGSRDMPLADILGGVLDLAAGSCHVQFAICTGTHDGNTRENEAICDLIRSKATQAGLVGYDIVIHDCKQPDLIDAGTTSTGTPVRYNPVISDAEVFCVLSDVKSHYFAGYSNPVKNLVPGLCSYETAERNHSFALDDRSVFGVHPWHEDAGRRDNPLAADQVEAMELIVRQRQVFAMVTISTSGKIQWADFGLAKDVSARAFSESDRRNTRKIARTKRMIVSPGGLPNDVDLYISQRALELTKTAVGDGGEVLFVSACPKGVGHERTRENFYDRLIRPIDEIFASIEGEYKLFSHKPYRFAQMIRRLRRIWVHSEMPDEIVEAMHLFPTADPQEVVDGWLSEEAEVKITVVDGANKIALYS
jgi:nickel-dependent lactate racemase